MDELAELKARVDRLESMLGAVTEVTGAAKLMKLVNWQVGGVDYTWWESRPKRDAAKG